MSINAISSVSLYEYYYRINKDEHEKKESPLADQMREYGLIPTEDEALNAILLKQAIAAQKAEQETSQEIPPSQRPWADLMYQLNIQFNEDPKDDIEDIKEELALLTRGMNDEELNKEISDLESYVERLYLSYQQNNISRNSGALTINAQLNNLAMINQINLF